MNNILYVIAGILLVFWITGFIFFHATWGHVSAIHGLLLFAAIAIFIRMVKWNKLD